MFLPIRTQTSPDGSKYIELQMRMIKTALLQTAAAVLV